MGLEKPCDYCGERKAVTACEVCGSQVCGIHRREYGCAVCDGGEKSFS